MTDGQSNDYAPEKDFEKPKKDTLHTKNTILNTKMRKSVVFFFPIVFVLFFNTEKDVMHFGHTFGLWILFLLLGFQTFD